MVCLLDYFHKFIAHYFEISFSKYLNLIFTANIKNIKTYLKLRLVIIQIDYILYRHIAILLLSWLQLQLINLFVNFWKMRIPAHLKLIIKFICLLCILWIFLNRSERSGLLMKILLVLVDLFIFSLIRWLGSWWISGWLDIDLLLLLLLIFIKIFIISIVCTPTAWRHRNRQYLLMSHSIIQIFTCWILLSIHALIINLLNILL
jgi:hypothetical protein